MASLSTSRVGVAWARRVPLTRMMPRGFSMNRVASADFGADVLDRRGDHFVLASWKDFGWEREAMRSRCGSGTTCRSIGGCGRICLVVYVAVGMMIRSLVSKAQARSLEYGALIRSSTRGENHPRAFASGYTLLSLSRRYSTLNDSKMNFGARYLDFIWS